MEAICYALIRISSPNKDSDISYESIQKIQGNILQSTIANSCYRLQILAWKFEYGFAEFKDLDISAVEKIIENFHLSDLCHWLEEEFKGINRDISRASPWQKAQDLLRSS